MERNRIGLLVVILTAAIAVAGHSAELLEVGARIDLSLEPLRLGGNVRWNFAVGGYALVRLNEGWGVRASAGYNLLNAGPYVSVGVARTVVESVLLEGDLNFYWNSRERRSSAALDAGVRFRSRPSSDQRSSLAIFPASWTLNMATGRATSFSFSPSFTAEAALVLETGLLIGGAAGITFLRVPSLMDEPAWPIGGGWMLSTRLTTHIGYVPSGP